MAAAQARAEATRQAIIAAAVRLFQEVGYGNTDMIDIIDRAEVTKGGFYYHFKTKEAVAAAIIEEADARTEDVYRRIETPSSVPALENLIQATFVAAFMTEHDDQVRVGNLLRQALTQVAHSQPETFTQRRAAFVAAVKQAIAEGDLSDDLEPEEVGNALWVSTLGARLMSDATGEDVFVQLTRVWRVILAGVVAPESKIRYRRLVAKMSREYGHTA